MADTVPCETDDQIQEKTISSQTEDLKKMSENIDGNDNEAPLKNGSIDNHVEDKEIVQASDSLVVEEKSISESNEADCGTADEKPSSAGNEADCGDVEEKSSLQGNEADSGIGEKKPTSKVNEADSGTSEETSKSQGNEADSGSTKDSTNIETSEHQGGTSMKVESVTSTEAVTNMNPNAEESKANGDVDKKEDKADKKEPLLGSTVAKHYNEIPEGSVELRKTSRIYHLRNFNNWIKSVVISDYLEKIKRRKRVSDDINVLDLACGKGGDLLKWQKGKVDHLIMADIASTSIEQCKERYAKLQKEQRNNRYYRDRLFTSECFVADCTKVVLNELYRRKDIKLDLSSCQFAFHYSFESYEQADVMLKNLCENLRVGGYFIGTTPDAQKLVKHIKDCKADSFGNSVYNIKPEDKETFPLFGSKYMFYLEGVVNCPEFIVYFPLLEKMAAKYNMKLVWKKNFHDIFKENERQHAALLAKMSALEQYPASKDKTLAGGSESQYKSAKDYVDKKGNRRVGTLSADEWEVAGLYIAFAFEKMEPPREARPKEREDRKRHRDGGRSSSSRSHDSHRDKHRSESSSAKKVKKDFDPEDLYEVKDEIYEDDQDKDEEKSKVEKTSKGDEHSRSRSKSKEGKERSHHRSEDKVKDEESPCEIPAAADISDKNVEEKLEPIVEKAAENEPSETSAKGEVLPESPSGEKGITEDNISGDPDVVDTSAEATEPKDDVSEKVEETSVKEQSEEVMEE